jgi:sugar O-acyltransferase (sialic acid O-acetyltransferase NeuD family)
MYKHLVIVGAGGHGQAIADLALSISAFQKISFLDDAYPKNSHAVGLSIVGNTDTLFLDEFEFDACIVAIGNNRVRELVIQRILSEKLPLINLIHPKAFVSNFAQLGLGIAIMAGAVIGTNAKLGLGSLVNANATVDHDCILEPFSHLGVGVQLAGGVYIGKSSWLQAGCSAGYFVKIDNNLIIPPGTALVS